MDINEKGEINTKILLIDNDDDFKKRFCAYLAEGCRDAVLTVTDDAGASSAMTGDAELILVDERAASIESLVISGGEQLKSKTVILTPSDKDTGRYAGDGIRYISKFHSAREIISAVPELKAAYTLKLSARTAEDMSVTSVIGYGGGSGRTALSVALARLNTRMRLKETLVVSIKRCSDIWDYFPENSTASGDLNLMLLNHISGQLGDLSGMTETDSCGVYTFVRPENGINDIVSLSYEEMRSFINMIETTGLFGSVIFDISCDIPPKAVLDRSDRIMLINDSRRGTGESEGLWRSRVIYDDIEGKIIPIDNFVRPKTKDVIFLEDNFQNYSIDNKNYSNAKYYLPYDEDSFYIKNGLRDISMVGNYAKALSELVRSEMPL